MTRRILAVLLLAPTLAWGAAPKASITGPSAAAVGQLVIFDVSGSASDPDQPLRTKVKGPSSPTVRVFYDTDRNPGLLALTPTVPGRYKISVYTAGLPEGAKTLEFDGDDIMLDVGAPPPPPAPDPTPQPTPPGPTPPPLPIGDYDPAFVPLGKALAVQFGLDYAAAVESGAKMLDAGQTRTASYSTIAKEFSANRQASLERIASPALERVSPGSQADNAMTVDQKKALARAIRGLAKGAAGQ